MAVHPRSSARSFPGGGSAPGPSRGGGKSAHRAFHPCNAFTACGGDAGSLPSPPGTEVVGNGPEHVPRGLPRGSLKLGEEHSLTQRFAHLNFLFLYLCTSPPKALPGPPTEQNRSTFATLPPPSCKPKDCHAPNVNNSKEHDGIDFISQGPCLSTPKLGVTGITSSRWARWFCSAQDPRPKLTGTKLGEAIGGLACLVTASQPAPGGDEALAARTVE